MTKFAPRNDNVLILPDGGKNRHGKIWIPENAVKIPTRGTVVALGPGYLLADGTRAPIEDLKEGDRVEFLWDQSTRQLDLDGEIHLMMKEVFVGAVVTEEPLPEMVEPEADAEDTPEAEAPDPNRPGAMPQRIVLATR
jgi:chaperonin GroES